MTIPFLCRPTTQKAEKKQGCKRQRRCISPVYYSVSIRGKEIPACFLAFFSVVASSSNLSTSNWRCKVRKKSVNHTFFPKKSTEGKKRIKRCQDRAKSWLLLAKWYVLSGEFANFQVKTLANKRLLIILQTRIVMKKYNI